MSLVTLKKNKNKKVVKLIGGGSVFKGAYPVLFLLFGTTPHRIPFYLIPVSVSLRAARTFLKRLWSENKNFNPQFRQVSRHPGA